jgi:predicted RNA-binding protein Jag
VNTLLYKITGQKWKLLRTNIQICSNVTNPNSFHFENTEKCIKFTIYLSDILNQESGPPIYIERTHNIKNDIKNDDIKTFLGKKGDVLISLQNGLHRKLPQKNYTCGFLVFNFVCN